MPTKSACVLFLRSVYKNPGLSLFGFPKDPKRLQIWLSQCGLNESDIQSNRKLCSFHFVETDFGKGLKRKKLKHDAIPKPYGKRYRQNANNQNMPSPGKEPSEYAEIAITEDDVVIEDVIDEKVTDLPEVCPTEDEGIILSNECCESKNKFSRDNTPTKLKNSDMLIFGDIKSCDLETLKRAKKNFMKARLKTMNQRKQIRALHPTVRILKNKITLLQKLIEHIRNINLINEQAHDDI